MRRSFITAILVILFNPITAHAFQTETDVQGIAQEDRRIDRDKRERRAAREQAEAEAQAAEEAVVYTPAPVVSDGIDWDAIAECESGQNWSIDTGNDYYDGLQFSHDTWIGAGGGVYASDAHLATREQQITIASTLSLSNWPYCQRYA